MPSDVLSLPWWAALYLCTIYGASAVGLYEDWRNNRVAAIGGTMSLACVTAFVLSFHNAAIAGHFGYLFIPMLLVGVLWEFTQSVHETARAQAELSNEQELNDGEKNFLVNMAVGLNALIVVPGYAYGFMLCYGLLVGG